MLKNFRGIAHRDIEFPDSGVVVVSGANEIGKTSMFDALHLLLEYKDRSKHMDVKAVKPIHIDAGSEVTAEISTGPYRFVYYKRFHKRPETQLTVSAPRREQLTGDEAHERVEAIVAETVDTGLWKAQRVLQAGSTDAVNLSGCDALSRALDVAAGDVAALSGAEPRLLKDLDVEYARYFTPKGRATGEWAAAGAALTDADAEVAHRAALVAEVDERVRLHDELTGQLAVLTAEQGGVDARHAAAAQAGAKVAELNEALRQSELTAAGANLKRSESGGALAERERLRTDLDALVAKVNASATEVQATADAEATARAAAEGATAAAEAAAEVLADAERTVADARRVVGQLVDRDEAGKLAARLAKIDATQRDHDRVAAGLAEIVLTEDLLRCIEDAAAAADRAEAQLAAISATVELTAVADIELVIEGRRVVLPAGQSWSATATAPTEVEVAGVLTARVTPGATALDAKAEQAAAQQQLTDALAAGGVADLAAARRVDERRRDLTGSRDQLRATLDALCGDDRVEELRAQLEALRAGPFNGAAGSTTDLGTARTELAAAEAQHTALVAEREALRRAAAEATGTLTEQTTRVTVLRGNLESQRVELAAATDRLSAQRAEAADEALAARVDADRQAAETAAGGVTELSQQLTAAAPDAVATELAAATAAVETLRAQRDSVTGALRDVRVELDVFGSEGRQSKLDDALTSREHAAATHARIGRRARAVELLRSVLTRHRDDTRLRYVAPFRAEIERLGRPVFGDSCEIGVDTDLCIATRTLDGCTVPYESLSGGAKEQLGILVRLAGAALVAKEDTVPVLIDDALGFTDPDRLAKMGTVFDMVGADGQVIVLTCTPERYDGIKGAHRIDLNG